ncbi:MarR family winged helix-turn-helix transcriptional regulator [Enemella evansiae]|uniref:MarR family transcriptional regulator n=1 Tax=Enemella evansiae TaxID=2016499 RepID=A0A255GCH7_9ACTN|nr:MarR family winged helix-turn-helix transcriptional regulator [Enemella evansiae]OYN98278.1 MarR family transcriptional regulator [Enemella evansiae]OYN99252.1 MarR family transcriptional regulator [Enemella evansiae]OYO10614.1 MarR family transcriptional regulator [Enemella evansiae]OYO20511.1 MarR family transcriptional regulator [Enemella evansiae]TDO93038.1 DNA-binding MarR family transcriptional regulator [Enemella evansiae]
MAAPSGPVSPATEAERAMFDFVDAYDRAYEIAAAQHGMSVAHACVLGRIAKPRGMGELADELGCDASNITQVVTRLEARGLAERHANPNDRRSRQVNRTTAGDNLNAAFEKSFEFARTATSNLSDGEQNQLAELLRKALGQPTS